MIYQESMMRVAQKFAGYSLAEADNLRKACGKKDRELIAKEREKFVAEGCEATGYGATSAPRCSTSSSRSPTTRSTRATPTATGCVAYQTAYLKANYPVEYFAALLTSVKTNLDKAAVYLNECRQMGIPVLVPDVNVSMTDFVAVPSTAPTAWAATGRSRSGCRPCATSAGPGRRSSSPSATPTGRSSTSTTSATGSTSTVLNKRTIESLIKAGAFDSMGHPARAC